MKIDTRSRRQAIVSRIVEDTGINEPVIAQLVDHFYSAVRLDPLLDPIFALWINDWPGHIAHLHDFWSGVALMTGRFKGRPIEAHAKLGLSSIHYERWLELFRASAQETCPPRSAAFFIARAERIAATLQAGAARFGDVGIPLRSTGAGATETAVWSP